MEKSHFYLELINITVEPRFQLRLDILAQLKMPTLIKEFKKQMKIN
jgi:hypothetical protein